MDPTHVPIDMKNESFFHSNGNFKNSMSTDKAMLAIMESLMLDIEQLQVKMKIMRSMVDFMLQEHG